MSKDQSLLAGINPDITQEELERLLQVVSELDIRDGSSKLQDYSPYAWQQRFHAEGNVCNQRLLMAGNRTGKTFSGAAEMAYHLTGRYPDDWQGRKFEKPIRAWAAGISNAKTRDIVQRELCGEPEDPQKWGTGAIPKEDLVSKTRLPGVPNALQAVVIKHYTNGIYDGNSLLGFLSYEMGFEKFMGSPLDVIWLDEQTPYDIFSQCITRTADTGGMVYMTFTPEQGMTTVVHQFMNDIKPGQALVMATWDDCPHLTEEIKEQLLNVYLPHERDMRSKGLPVFGRGMVFPLSEDKIRCEPFQIPTWWRRIAAIDFGWEHPTAVVFIAIDPDTGCQYVYHTYRVKKTLPAIISAHILEVGPWVPMAWPHDGLQHEKGSGTTLSQNYRAFGVNMLPFHFTNPPAIGQEEGKGGNSVEAGILVMLQKMEADQFKVFSTQIEWFEEFRLYHRDDDGKIVPKTDDLMSATRYASQSARFADIEASSYRTGFGPTNMPNIEVC